MRKALCLLAMALVFTGCARMVVRKHPGPKDTGIRFYRPKPYLFIGPGGPAKEAAGKGDQKAGESGGEKCESVSKPETELTLLPVVMRVEYLPDYSEEYSIKMRPGLGITKLAVTLTDGWNLTSVNAETDQQYDEILKSVADLVSAVGSVAGGAKRASYNGHAESDVPLGYYEAVLACNECGTKELIGWRYIGFMPCMACPTRATVNRESYQCGQESLFALVFKGNSLRMQRMDTLGICPTCETTSKASSEREFSSGFVAEDVRPKETTEPENRTATAEDAEHPPLPQLSRPRRAKPR